MRKSVTTRERGLKRGDLTRFLEHYTRLDSFFVCFLLVLMVEEAASPFAAAIINE
jgi:hypothetical protein